MASDGSLSPSQSQDTFSRNYNDGIGQGSAASELPITGEEAEKAEEFRIAAVAPRAPVPRPDILLAIEETALRYGGHRGLRAADITVTDWLNLFRANIEIESVCGRPRKCKHYFGL